MGILDDLSPLHGIHSHGFPVDWQSDSCLSIWYVQDASNTSIDTEGLNELIGGIPPYIYGSIGGADRWVWFVRCP
jgi:hypothetical protein